MNMSHKMERKTRTTISLAQQLVYINMYKHYKADTLAQYMLLQVKNGAIRRRSKKQSKTSISVAQFARNHNISETRLGVWLQQDQLGYFWLTQKFRPDLNLEKSFHLMLLDHLARSSPGRCCTRTPPDKTVHLGGEKKNMHLVCFRRWCCNPCK